MPDLEQGILSDEPPLSTSEKDDAPATQSSQAGLSYKDVSEALFKLPTYHDIGTGGHGTVNHMHTNNVAYLKTKILKHALVFNAARAEAGEGLFKPLVGPARFEECRRDLEEYSIALKNWRYWKETPKHIHAYSQRFEWQSFASKLAVLELAESIGSKEPAFLAQSRREMMEALHFKLAEVRGDPIFQSEMERHDIRHEQRLIYWRRLWISVASGLALIVPMLIMTLHESKLTSLVTTSVFVLGVAVILALTVDDTKDIVGATAAYAAVLVVFVGTGSGSTD